MSFTLKMMQTICPADQGKEFCNVFLEHYWRSRYDVLEVYMLRKMLLYYGMFETFCSVSSFD